jgi:hypothetical protein
MTGTPANRSPLAPGRPALPLPRSARGYASLLVGLVLVYLSAAYLVVPAAWKRYARHHPAMEDVPGIAYTGSGIPGDPVNVSLIGEKAAVIRAMLAAKWYPADPLSLRSCLEIAEATVFKRTYDDAPVSSLYLWGHKEDLAFEQLIGRDPRKRHHVRFWRDPKDDPDGRPVWIGASILDVRVGLSHRTGQITHHTGPDVDAERDLLFQDLERTGCLAERYVVRGFHKTCQGRNGGGDPWHTDGDLYVGVLKTLFPAGAGSGREVKSP